MSDNEKTEKIFVKKKKRQPTAYNLFVREVMKTKECLELPPKERFKYCSQKWREKKAEKKPAPKPKAKAKAKPQP